LRGKLLKTNLLIKFILFCTGQKSVYTTFNTSVGLHIADDTPPATMPANILKMRVSSAGRQIRIFLIKDDH